MERANGWLATAWGRGWLAKPELDPSALTAAARRVAGLDDFGAENGWRARLHDLCRALDSEAALNPVGVTIAYGQLLSALANRLRAVEIWRRNPEIARVPITRPIIVVGQMRSGSTRMQRLLARDERLTFTRFFESWNPVPRWTRAGFDDRVLRGWLALRVANLLNPQFSVVHPARTFDPDEEIGLHNVALYGAAFEAQWRIPSFARAGEAADGHAVYEEFRRYLQTIRWMRRDRSDRPWVLKIPQFGQDLGTLLNVFPDARVVVLERDPVSVVASSASLVHSQMSMQTAIADKHWIGREWMRKTVLRKQRIAEGLRHHEVPRIEISYDEMQEDWRTPMRKVYDMLDLPLTPKLELQMARFLGQPRHRRLCRHRYGLDEFGLSATAIDAAYENGVCVAQDPVTLAAA